MKKKKRIKPPLEKAIVTNIMVYLRRLPCSWWIKMHGTRYSMAAVDIIGCYRGKFYAFEVKRPGGAVTPRQAQTISRLKEAGACADVVTSVADAVVIIDHHFLQEKNNV